MARWAVSPTDRRTHLLARDGDHPDGALKARCAELLPTTVVAQDHPHGDLCCPCSVIDNADMDLDFSW